MTKNYTSDYQHNRSFLRGLLPPKGWLVLVLFMMFSVASFGQGVFGGKIAVLKNGATTWYNTDGQACDGAGTGNLSSADIGIGNSYLGDRINIGGNVLTWGFGSTNDRGVLGYAMSNVSKAGAQGAGKTFISEVNTGVGLHSSGVCGNGSNKKYEFAPVSNKYQLQFTSTGNHWIAIQLGANNDSSYFQQYESGNVFTTNVLAIPVATSQTATASGTSQINLAWTKNSQSHNVMIVRSTDASFTAPTNGVAYTVGNTSLGGDTVIYNSNGTSFNDTGLDPSTTYYYAFYSENNSYYSAAATANATTSAGQEITVSTTSLTAFSDTCASAFSAEQSFTVSGSNLTANITVAAPNTDFQVSTTSGSGFGASVTLTQSGGSVSTTTIYARFSPQSTGAKSGNITATSTGATTKNVAVSGNAPVASTYSYLRTLTATATINQGSNATLEGEGYAAGITNPAGQAAGSIVEFGYNSSNTNPTSDVAWTWATATFDRQNGNNDLFRANSFGSALAPGTYYYTFRFKLTDCSAWQYTGTGTDNWSNNSGVLTVTGPAITGAKLGVKFNGGAADWGYAGLQDGCEGAIGAWQGKNLGTMSVTGSLVLDGANVFTNTTGSTNGILYYRVYKSDATPPAYDTYNIGSTQTNCGSRFKYENPTDFTIPSSKYSVAGTYRFEVYYEITNGSTLSQGSAVSPYQATFTITGPAITGAKLGVIFNGGGADWGYAGLQDGCEGAIGAWHGKNLGTMSVTGSLVLDGANVFTNTAGSTNGILYYRVYKSDDTPPAYDTYNIGSTQTNCGSSFKYENPTDFTIPSSKYSVAGTYRFEVYYEITNGSTLSQGSAVSPYQATFTITEPTNDTFYSDRIYFKNGTASSEKYYAEYNAVPNGGCTGNNSETAGTEAWNGRNLGTYTTGTTAQLGAFIVTKGVQNGNGPIFRYRVYETGSTPPVFLQSNLNYVGECNADGVQVNGSDLDKIWRLPLSNISIPSTPGNYTIEVYFERSGDQMGNNGTQYIRNGGSNYKAYIDVQPPTGIISSKVYLKKNSDAEIVYLAGADTDCDPGGTVNFNGLSTGIVTADAYKIGGNFISTLAMTSPKLNYLLYPLGARPSSPVFSEINLSNVSTCSTRFKYEASSATQLFNSNEIVSGTYVLELYFSGVNGGTTYYKRPDPTNNYVSYFTISEPHDGNLNPTGTNISGIYESYIGQLILGLDDSGNPNPADRKKSKVFDLDGNYASSNNSDFDLGSTNPGVSFRVGMEAKVFTKGTHKACGCSSWYYLYKDGQTDPVESDFPLPAEGTTAVLYSQKWGSSVRKFTLMNSSMSWQGLNTPFQALTGNVTGYGDNSPGFGSTTPDGTYNGQLGTGASVVKYKDYKDRDGFSPAETNMAVDTPVNEVACPTCDGTYRIAVAFLCWVQTDSTKKCPGDSGFSSATDAPTIIYHRDINQNKIHNGVYLNPRHPNSPYYTNNKNSLPGTTVFYVSKLDVNASGGDTTYNGSWNNGTPTRGKNTFINSNYSTSSGSFITNNLTVADGVTLTIRSGEYVEVLNTATTLGSGETKGKIVVEKGGNFVQRCNEKIPANGVPYPNIEHTHQTRTIAPFDYVYWSSPIRENIKGTLETAGMGRMFYWQGGAGGGWRNLTTTAADTFGAGKGFIAWNADKTTAKAFSPKFVGTATNGEVKVAVTKQDVYPDESDAAALATYSSNFNNYALLGNPYPCAIDAREFLVHANNQHIGGTIYVWTSNTRLSQGTRGVYTSGDYATYTLAGGTNANPAGYAYGETSGDTYGNNDKYNEAGGSNRMIFSGSAFFVLVKQNGDAFFNNEMRSTTGNSNSGYNWALFKGNEADAPKEENRLWLSIGNEVGAYRQTLLAYREGATEGYDGYLDALVNSSNAVNIYTKSKDNHKLVIQARPESLLDANETVPLALSSLEADDFYIKVDIFEGKFKEKDIFLKDKKMGVLHDFSTGKYHFSTESGTYEDRFEIVYKDKPKASIEEPADANAPLKVAVADHLISISKTGKKITNAEFTNILGKQIKVKSFDSLDVATVHDIIKANQVLIVKVTFADGTTETKKIIF